MKRKKTIPIDELSVQLPTWLTAFWFKRGITYLMFDDTWMWRMRLLHMPQYKGRLV